MGILLSVSIFFETRVIYRDAQPSQAAKSLSASQDNLISVLERIENFFSRLEMYVKVSPAAGMTDVIVKIMIEVLSILSIATKEIKQSRASTFIIQVGINGQYQLTVV
jgi:hypothetical protein